MNTNSSNTPPGALDLVGGLSVRAVVGSHAVTPTIRPAPDMASQQKSPGTGSNQPGAWIDLSGAEHGQE